MNFFTNFNIKFFLEQSRIDYTRFSTLYETCLRMFVEVIRLKNMVDTWFVSKSIQAIIIFWNIVFKSKGIGPLFSFLNPLLYQSMVVSTLGLVKDILKCHDMFVINENDIVSLLDGVSQLGFSSFFVLIKELLEINNLFWDFLFFFCLSNYRVRSANMRCRLANLRSSSRSWCLN